MTDKRAFSFGGKNCREFGVICSGSGTYGAPERDVESVEVPGRSGTLLLDRGRWKNISVTYPCFIPRNLGDNMAGLRAWLLSRRGYQRLEDGYDPAHYRLAQFCAALSPEVAAGGRAASFDVTFDCKPQRYLVSGEMTVRPTNGGVLTNPTLFDALPLITVTGSGAGTLTVGDVVVTISAMPEEVLVLDCETQDARGATANRNSVISAPVFPSLAPGATAISWAGGIESVSVVPRWWTL